MAAKTIRAAPNGAKMVEAELRAGSPAVLVAPLMYTVTSPRTPVAVYQGPNRAEADKAFELAAKA